MGAKRHTDASITIRFGKDVRYVLSVPVLTKILSEFSDYFIIGTEFSDPSQPKTQHYHSACRLRKEDTISDNFKNKLISRIADVLDFELTPDNLKVAFDIKYHNDFDYYVGYCCKQDTTPFFVGMDSAYVDYCKEYYANKSAKIKARVPVGRTAYLELIKSAYIELYDVLALNSEKHDKYFGLNQSQKLAVLERILISKGYDLTCVPASNKREVMFNFDAYIVRGTEGGETLKEIVDSF